MKTKNDIIKQIITIINGTAIKDLNGSVTAETRLTDSVLNDCVVAIIASTTDKFIRYGALTVKIFYQDTFLNNTYFEDLTTGATIETLLYNLSTTLLTTNGYSFDVNSRELYTERVQDDNKHEHFAILKINFKLIN
ncbi:MAG: hypothetical protein IPO21_14425 [Bacteroidales bacterium]|nr:hypothetical protein [Bacteroidales bacterium]